MNTLQTFAELNNQQKALPQEDQSTRSYIMDDIYHQQKEKSFDRLCRATKFLSTHSTRFFKQLDHAENNYDLFHSKLSENEVRKEQKRLRKQTQRFMGTPNI